MAINGQAQDTILLDGTCAIVGINANVDLLNFDIDSGVKVSLKHDGIMVMLFDSSAASPQDCSDPSTKSYNLVVVLDDNAATVSDVCDSNFLFGDIQPLNQDETTFSNFYGLQAAGEWKLVVTDGDEKPPAFDARLASWSVGIYCTQPSDCANQEPSCGTRGKNPGVKQFLMCIQHKYNFDTECMMPNEIASVLNDDKELYGWCGCCASDDNPPDCCLEELLLVPVTGSEKKRGLRSSSAGSKGPKGNSKVVHHVLHDE
jgi:hypothetical protein